MVWLIIGSDSSIQSDFRDTSNSGRNLTLSLFGSEEYWIPSTELIKTSMGKEGPQPINVN
jgi:hypothetical protein